MTGRFFKPIFTAALAAIFVSVNFAQAQNGHATLQITRQASAPKEYNRITPKADMDHATAFHRLRPLDAPTKRQNASRRQVAKHRSSRFLQTQRVATAVSTASFGTGGGDVFEVEPNNLFAQSISLPVNIFGEITVNGDVDFYSFQAQAGEQITVEAFAARLQNSELIADIALFDSSSQLIAADAGDEDDDPLLRYIAPRDEILIVGVADLDDLGGSQFDYILNITRGVDIEESEPNGTLAQNLAAVPATIFGEINGRSDVDFYSFTAAAGQTLIVDVDAETLGSSLDSEINLQDPETGVEFFYNDQEDGDDSRFNIVLPHTGRYVIGIGAFNADSLGFYRLNVSLVPATTAPVITRVVRLSKKLIEVHGSGFSRDSDVEANSVLRKTTFINSGTLRAKVKARVGNVITVSNLPDKRRSNPLVVQ